MSKYSEVVEGREFSALVCGLVQRLVQKLVRGLKNSSQTVSQRINPAVWMQIAQLSLDHDEETQEALAKEGWNLVFEKYEKPPIT